MATPTQSFTLDRGIFNETLYSRLRDFWFHEVPEGTVVPTVEMTARWFGANRSEVEKEAFDKECHTNFGEALRSLGPEKLALPPFDSYEKDLEHAEEISAPLYREVKDAHNRDLKESTQTLLSLILLLDQMPRNTLRDDAGLKLVFTHYDRLAWTLLRSSMKLTPNPMEHEFVRGKPLFLTWFLIPMMHSEHMPSHELYLEIVEKTQKDLEDQELSQSARDYLKMNIDFELKHQEPLKRFGRYPHRNHALGRQSTKEEEDYMRSGETFGVKQKEKVAEEDEKKNLDKSEL